MLKKTNDQENKIIFAGTPEFAVPSLKTLLINKYPICAVYTQPDRPAGRGLKLSPTPIKRFALDHGLPIYQPLTLKTPEAQQQLQSLNAKIMIDVAYGLILPEPVLNMFKFGCINVHPSLLPRWRGAAPIQRAILNGDSETGITIMQMDTGLDTGDILSQIRIPIKKDTTSHELFEKLATLGADLLLQTLQDFLHNKIKPIKQNDAEACYAHKIEKSEALINWQLSAEEIVRLINAFNSWPVAFTTLQGQVIKIWKASALKNDSFHGQPGIIIKLNPKGIDVLTSEGILRLLEIQLAGGKVLPVATLINGRRDLFKLGAICGD